MDGIMKRIPLLLLLGLFFLPASSYGLKNYVYRQGNNPVNYVKFAKLSRAKRDTLSLNQPYTFTEDQMADILRSLRYNRRALFSDKIKTRKVFEEEYIERFTPYLVKAFKEVKPDQIVYFSVAQKRPYFIIRNDRLTQVAMWITGQELHVRFDKTDAKLPGDYKARTPEGRRMREIAVGLRISLEPQTGQKLAFDSSRELILDINSNWETIVVQIEAEEERIRKEQEIKKARGSKKKRLKAEAQVNQPVAPPPPMSTKDQKNAEDRLSELKKLKDKGLIDQSDYDKKKKEILQNL